MSDDTQKILSAIVRQRFYFFENNDRILFDGKTALVWANLRYFPYAKNIDGNGERYSRQGSFAEARELLNSTNATRFGDFNDWKIPTPFELWDLVEDDSFPFRSGSYHRIENQDFWCVYHNGHLAVKDLDSNGALSTIHSSYDHCVIPCSHALVPKGFHGSPQEILDIFKAKNLVPKFDDATITELYKKLLSAKNKPAKPEITLAEKFDGAPLSNRFNVAELAASPIKYFDAVNELADALLDALQAYETAQAATIGEFSQAALKLGEKYTDNPNLTPDENRLLADRQKFLARRLELRTDEPKSQILSLKTQAEKFFTRLDDIICGDNSIRELVDVKTEARTDFAFLVENYVRIVQNAQSKLNFFIEHKDLVINIVNAWTTWTDDYAIFKTSLREKLFADCRADNVDEEIFTAWYEDWRTKRFEIEQKFLPPIEFALKGHLFGVVEKVLQALHDYRDEIDRFYLQERKGIYQDFAFNAGGELQDEFTTDSRLFAVTEKFQLNLQKIIFACDKVEERIFLLKWAESLLDLSVKSIVEFVKERALDKISDTFLTQFSALRRQNFATYLTDAEAYGKALEKRNKEFNQLIFRMRKGLANK